MRKKTPKFLNQIRILTGNLGELGLGLSVTDTREVTENVEILIHAAADVRFDIPLLSLVIVNLRGTRELVRLAERMRKLQMLTYVSTAYSNCPLLSIEEAFYKPPMDPELVIRMAEAAITEEDQFIYEILTTKLIAPWPNTYTYTKALSEEVVRQFGQRCLVAVVRPTVGKFIYKKN